MHSSQHATPAKTRLKNTSRTCTGRKSTHNGIEFFSAFVRAAGTVMTYEHSVASFPCHNE
jgi:hypothetical protein